MSVLDLDAIKTRDTALRPDGEAWTCSDCGWCSGCSRLLPCDSHEDDGDVLDLVAEVERLRERVNQYRQWVIDANRFAYEAAQGSA